MSTASAACLTAAVTIVLVGLAFFLVGRAWADHIDRQALDAVQADDEPGEQYDGPDSLRLLQDLDAHLDPYFDRLAHLFEELGPPPAKCGGPDRLLRAVRDEQQNGDQK